MLSCEDRAKAESNKQNQHISSVLSKALKVQLSHQGPSYSSQTTILRATIFPNTEKVTWHIPLILEVDNRILE